MNTIILTLKTFKTFCSASEGIAVHITRWSDERNRSNTLRQTNGSYTDIWRSNVQHQFVGRKTSGRHCRIRSFGK